MSPTDKAKDELNKMQKQGCKPDPTLKQAMEAYERQAENADRLLREKQARERNSR